MIEIGDTIISRDLVESFFHCDLSGCKGGCCIEGDSGAPLEKEEYDIIRQLLPKIWDYLSPQARTVINRQGIGYHDIEGETVTSLVGGRDCVFTCYDDDGTCRCAIEKLYHNGLTGFRKPVSCHLYPVRVKKYNNYSAVNYNRWKICRAAEILGEQKRVRLYQFLREPLIRKFGLEWFQALDSCAKDYLKIID